jgi:hypothetical protein
MSEFNPDDLDPGIRRTVLWLRKAGFDTTDSGDGVSKFKVAEPMEGALDYPHVVCVLKPEELYYEAIFMARLVQAQGVKVVQNGRREPGQAEVQASLDPADGSAILVLAGVGDAELFPGGA